MLVPTFSKQQLSQLANVLLLKEPTDGLQAARLALSLSLSLQNMDHHDQQQYYERFQQKFNAFYSSETSLQFVHFKCIYLAQLDIVNIMKENCAKTIPKFITFVQKFLENQPQSLVNSPIIQQLIGLLAENTKCFPLFGNKLQELAHFLLLSGYQLYEHCFVFYFANAFKIAQNQRVRQDSLIDEVVQNVAQLSDYIDPKIKNQTISDENQRFIMYFKDPIKIIKIYLKMLAHAFTLPQQWFKLPTLIQMFTQLLNNDSLVQQFQLIIEDDIVLLLNSLYQNFSTINQHVFYFIQLSLMQKAVNNYYHKIVCALKLQSHQYLTGGRGRDQYLLLAKYNKSLFQIFKTNYDLSKRLLVSEIIGNIYNFGLYNSYTEVLIQLGAPSLYQFSYFLSQDLVSYATYRSKLNGSVNNNMDYLLQLTMTLTKIALSEYDGHLSPLFSIVKESMERLIDNQSLKFMKFDYEILKQQLQLLHNVFKIQQLQSQNIGILNPEEKLRFGFATHQESMSFEYLQSQLRGGEVSIGNICQTKPSLLMSLPFIHIDIKDYFKEPIEASASPCELPFSVNQSPTDLLKWQNIQRQQVDTDFVDNSSESKSHHDSVSVSLPPGDVSMIIDGGGLRMASFDAGSAKQIVKESFTPLPKQNDEQLAKQKDQSQIVLGQDELAQDPDIPQFNLVFK